MSKFTRSPLDGTFKAHDGRLASQIVYYYVCTGCMCCLCTCTAFRFLQGTGVAYEWIFVLTNGTGEQFCSENLPSNSCLYQLESAKSTPMCIIHCT